MLQAAYSWVKEVEQEPMWCDGSALPSFPELFLCEMMHQISLSMADDRRVQMVEVSCFAQIISQRRDF